MTEDNRTTESLLARRALAEKATPEKWNLLQIFAEDENYVGPETWADMGKAVCICRYAKDAQYIAANSPDVVMADIDEILRLREEMERLEKEADWLAKNLEYACYNKEDGSGCFTCEQLCPELVNEHKMKNRDGYKTCRGATLYGWREAARKAVEEISYE